MSVRKRSRLVVAALLVAALGGAAHATTAVVAPEAAAPAGATAAVGHTGPTLARAAAPACSPGWGAATIATNRSLLTSVVAAGAEAWAVGMVTPFGPPRYSLASHWDGTSWLPMRVAPDRFENGLFGIDRSPGGHMWAVGYRSVNSMYRPIVVSWNGHHWRHVALHDAGLHPGSLEAVATLSDDNAWAVGYSVDSDGQQPLALHLSGGTWRDSSPGLASGSGALLGVTATENAIFAVGWVANGGAPAAYITAWDGRAWRRASPARISASESGLTDVTSNGAHQAWAVGYQLLDGAYRPLVESWDGRRWRYERLPSAASPMAFLRSIHVDRDGSPVVLGSRWDDATGTWAGFVMKREDGVWGSPSTLDAAAGSEYQDLAAAPEGREWVVGSQAGQALATTWCPGTPPTIEGPPAPAGSPPPAEGSTPGETEGPGLPPGASPSPALAVEASAPGGSATPRADGTLGPVADSGATAFAGATAAVRTTATPGRRGDSRPRKRHGTSGGGITARDVASEVGLGATTMTFNGATADFDGNGWPDLFISRYYGPGWLLMNDGGTFSSPPDQDFPARDRHGCSAGDVNGDGLPDIYCVGGALRGTVFKTNELWINQGGGKFTEEAVPWRGADPLGRGRLTTFFNLDHDAHADVFVGNRPTRPDGLPSPDEVLAAPSGESFVRRSVAGFDPRMGADCVRAADLDKDGWQDIVLCRRGIDRPNGTGLQILHNDHGVLRDITARSGIPPMADMDAVVTDMNGDGKLDIVEVSASRLRVDIQAGGRFVPGASYPLKGGWGVAAGDVDGDGDPDLYVLQGIGNHQTPDMLLRNVNRGRGLKPFPIPEATNGSADAVIAIDYDRNGLTDFLVLNGDHKAGPVQLIAFFRTSGGARLTASSPAATLAAAPTP